MLSLSYPLDSLPGDVFAVEVLWLYLLWKMRCAWLANSHDYVAVTSLSPVEECSCDGNSVVTICPNMPIQYWMNPIRLLDFSSPQSPALSNALKPQPTRHQPSGSATIYEISATKHVAWFTFSLLLWIQVFWNKFDGRKFCVNILFNLVLPKLPHFRIIKNH